MILGFTGTNGSGKTVAAAYFRRRGFGYESLSDEIRDELSARGLTATRERMTEVGNELRTRLGAGVLAERVRSRLTPGRDYIVDSVRNPAETAALRHLEGFRLVRFNAPLELRYRRAVERADARVPRSLEEFAEQEGREMASDDPSTQQLRACFALADHTVSNDGPLTDLEQALDRLEKMVRQETSVIDVIASVRVKQDCMEELLGRLRANLAAVRAEDGCIHYYPTIDADSGLAAQERNTLSVTIVEQWRDLPALQAHLKTPHMLSYRETVKDLVVGVSLKVLRRI